MNATVAKWGNSLAVRLPKAAAAEARLIEGARVQFHSDGESLVITASRPKYKLADLLAKMTPEHRRPEFPWGDKDYGEERLDEYEHDLST